MCEEMNNENYLFGCDECNSPFYHPCEHIDDVMDILNISERTEENDKKIRKYLFDNCCNKSRNRIKRWFLMISRKIFK